LKQYECHDITQNGLENDISPVVEEQKENWTTFTYTETGTEVFTKLFKNSNEKMHLEL
jgi:hypothetical protein